MPSLLASPFAPVVQLIQAQLVAKTGVPVQAVKVIARDSSFVPHFQGDRDLLLRFSGPQPQGGFLHGSGRVASILERHLQVTCRVRLNADPSDDDLRSLIDPNYGLYLLEEAVIDALWGFWPTDAQGNTLTVTVIQWVASPPEQKQLAVPPPLDWVEGHLAFLIPYQANLPSGPLYPQLS
jgi:hypothetical protein